MARRTKLDTKIIADHPVTLLERPAHSDAHGVHAHLVQFYEDDAFLLDELCPYIGSALGAGDSCVVIATEAHRTELARRLAEFGFDVAIAARQGRYVALDAAETLSKFMLNGLPDPQRFADVVGGVLARSMESARGDRPRVAAFGEMVALLWADGKPEAAIQLEQLWNDLAHEYSFDLHCAYPMSFFSQAGDGASIEDICATHSHVIPAESYTSLHKEEARLRAIVLLQQKAQALETELQERKRMEQELREKNEELRQAIAARDEFMSVAAHELRTPLTGLRAYAQLLLKDIRQERESTPERLETALHGIELQTGKLSRLIGRLLDSAQIEAGKLRVEPAQTDLVALLHSIVAHQPCSADCALVYKGPDQLEATVDPLRFEQVLTNLLDNAIKFSPQGGVITVELGQGADGSIQLSVTDQGLGIAPEQRQAVFDRFYQAHSEDHMSGIGLGLYITREIVELHGGSVRVEQPEHPGSRFVVTLPPTTAGA